MTPQEKADLVIMFGETMLRKFRLFYSHHYTSLTMSELTMLTYSIDVFFEACQTLEAGRGKCPRDTVARHDAFSSAAKIAGIMAAHDATDDEITYFLNTIA